MTASAPAILKLDPTAETSTQDFTKPPPHVKNFGTSPIERASAEAREELRKAEKKAQEAMQRVETERQALIAKQERIEVLCSKRDPIIERLANLARIDFSAQRATCEKIVSELLGSRRLTSEPARLVELDSAVKVLAEIPAVEKLLPGIIAAEQAKLVAVERELADLEAK